MEIVVAVAVVLVVVVVVAAVVAVAAAIVWGSLYNMRGQARAEIFRIWRGQSFENMRDQTPWISRQDAWIDVELGAEVWNFLLFIAFSLLL